AFFELFFFSVLLFAVFFLGLFLLRVLFLGFFFLGFVLLRFSLGLPPSRTRHRPPAVVVVGPRCDRSVWTRGARSILLAVLLALQIRQKRVARSIAGQHLLLDAGVVIASHGPRLRQVVLRGEREHHVDVRSREHPIGDGTRLGLRH